MTVSWRHRLLLWLSQHHVPDRVIWWLFLALKWCPDHVALWRWQRRVVRAH